MTDERMLDDSAPAEFINLSDGMFTGTYGVRIQALAAGDITHFRWWHVSGCGGTDHVPTLWADDGTQLLVGNGSGSVLLNGYKEVALDVPHHMETGDVVWASYMTWGGTHGESPEVQSLAPSLAILGSAYQESADVPPASNKFPTIATTDNLHMDVVFVVGEVIPPPDESKGLTKARQTLLAASSG